MSPRIAIAYGALVSARLAYHAERDMYVQALAQRAPAPVVAVAAREFTAAMVEHESALVGYVLERFSEEVRDMPVRAL